MSCLKEGSEGRVMECSENELGEYRMEAEKRGAPGLVGVSEGKSRSLGFRWHGKWPCYSYPGLS